MNHAATTPPATTMATTATNTIPRMGDPSAPCHNQNLPFSNPTAEHIEQIASPGAPWPAPAVRHEPPSHTG